MRPPADRLVVIAVGGALGDAPARPAATLADACRALAELAGATVVVALRAAAGRETDAVELAETAAQHGVALGVIVVDHAPTGQLARLGTAAPAEVDRQPSFGPAPLGGARIDDLGPGTPAHEAAGRLTEPTELMFLDGPCGGEHLGLGNVMLCRLGDQVTVPDGAAAMPCFHGAPCAMERPGLARVATGALRARRIVAITCSGLRLGNLPLYAALNPGTGLAANPATEAMLTAIGHVRDGEPEVVAAYYLVNAGLGFGAIAGVLCRMRLARGSPGNIVCVGDPTSRIAPTVTDATATRTGDRLVIRAPSDRRPWQDLRVAVPGEVADHCAIDVAGVVRAGVLLADGTLFVTVPGDAGEVIVELARPGAPELASSLARDLAGLAAAVGRWIEDPAPHEDLAECLELLDLWPGADAVAGTLIAGGVLAGARDLLTAALGRAHTGILAAYRAAVHGRGSTIPISAPLAAAHRFAALCPLETDCVACGSPVDEQRFVRRTGETTRTFHVCRACGPIYDGTGAIARWAEAAGAWRGGARIAVALDVTNPYPFPAVCRVAFAVRDYIASEALALHGEAEAVLAPGGTTRITVALDIPRGVLPGVHMLGAIVLVGGQIACLRRIVAIAASTEAAA